MRSRIPHIGHQHLPRLSPTAGWIHDGTLRMGRVPDDYPVGTRFTSPAGLVVELVRHEHVTNTAKSGKQHKRKVCWLVELGRWTRGMFQAFEDRTPYQIYSTYGRGPNDGGGDLGGWQVWRRP